MPSIKRLVLSRHGGKQIWPKLRRNSRRIIRISLVLVLALSLMPANATSEGSAVASGKSFVEKNCSGCHTVGPSGESRHPDAPAFRTLSKRYPLENLEESLAEGISTGHPDMPEFEVRPREIVNIIRYLNTIQEK
jgi:cytochrome c